MKYPVADARSRGKSPKAFNDHEMLVQDPAFGKIAEFLQHAASDGWISDGESSTLLSMINEIVDPASHNAEESIEYDGRNFVLTGNFEHGSKSNIGALIASKGGIIQKNVTKTTDYVVIGGCGSDEYALGNYGTKVKKALDWKAKGVPMEIVKECDLFRG